MGYTVHIILHMHAITKLAIFRAPGLGLWWSASLAPCRIDDEVTTLGELGVGATG
jgi:hypothetical protein